MPGSLVNENVESVVIKGDKLYEIASRYCVLNKIFDFSPPSKTLNFVVYRFYCRAIKLSNSSVSLWYELSLNYFKRSIKYGTDETKKKYLSLAAEAAKHVIKEAPHKWKHWNLLGVISTTKGNKFEMNLHGNDSILFLLFFLLKKCKISHWLSTVL